MAIPSRQPSFDRDERRRTGRIGCGLTMCQFGAVSDMSRTGCRVLSRKKIVVPEGKSVNLRFEASGAGMVLAARPVSCRVRDDGWHDVGFVYLDQSEETQRQVAAFARSVLYTSTEYRAAG